MSKNNVAVSAVVSQSQQWNGPIPSPNDLAAFNKVVPNAAERILAMAESESNMRRDITARNSESDNRRKENEIIKYHEDVRRGQLCAFTVLVCAIAGATLCAYLHCEKVGMMIAGMGFVGIVSNFIWKKK